MATLIDSMPGILVIILVAGLLILVFFHFVYQTYSILKELINYFFKDTINRHLPFYHLSSRRKKILHQYCFYYRLLREHDKKIFEKRVQKFISIKKFIPRGGLQAITEEMKVLIAASAIQLTFGHPGIYFKHFWRILVYPDTYYSTISKKHHSGEVNLRGIIVISWKKFLEGITDRSDGVNLGIHEMAHALHFENILGSEEFRFLNDVDLEVFDNIAEKEIKRIKTGSSSFFRKYAAANRDEFFAVAVENFFERPRALHEYNPAIYNILKKILNQDMLLLLNDHV